MKPAFDLKSSRIDTVAIKLHHAEATAAEQQLHQHATAYQAFAGMPFVLDVQAFDKVEKLDLKAIITTFGRNGLPICALQHSDASPEWQTAAASHGLAFCTPQRKNDPANERQQAPEPTETVSRKAEASAHTTNGDKAASNTPQTTTASNNANHPPAARQTIVIERPVRTGQQVYAEQADLIILGMVSEGAEVIADGHIHIYAPMRGRALAGANGDKNARIFIQTMQAELVSIAGIYRTFDQDLPKHLQARAVQVSLQEDRLVLAALDGGQNQS